MVFNWFRRQMGTSEGATNKETQAQTPEVEEEQQATQEQPSEDAEDLLKWAKAAYQNIQKQQESAETEPKVDLSSDTEAVEVAEVPEETAPTPEAEATPEPEPTVSESEVETATAAEEATTAPLPEQPVEAPSPEATIIEAAEVTQATSAEAVEEVPTEEPVSEEPTTIEPEVYPTEEPVTVESVTTETETTTPVAQELVAVESEAVEPAPPSTEEAPAAPTPIWARASAERQARLERLRETAIEIPESEPARTPIQQPMEPAATTTISAEEIPELAFDEGFLWSAQVLAAQGRRPEDISAEEISWLKRLRQGLGKTRRGLVNQLKAIVGQGPLNQDAVMEIEALLLQADVGIEATDYIIETLQSQLRQEALPPEQAIAYLKGIIREMLDQPYKDSYTPTFAPEKDTLNIWLMTGVNGAGKTTTIGKMAHLAKKSGYNCLIGAADTFRAAAVEQVKIWGERSGTEVIANPGKNTDPAAVVFDAITAAQARNTELLLVDTAGRLQNKKNLMEELAKIRRIVDKKAPNAKVESLLVLDATLGQNGLRQAEVFSQAAKLSGVVLTKLDSTAKGGVALAVVRELGLPIRFIGAGEGIEDLRPFSSYEFVEALLNG
jgi:fused signal recognition particle receptor